ncbi:hypothetical protein N780_01295 [Pontibacillus chungwhensis BH030062]|uniref:Uncharacterized protein n=1 Tax=Pontibacillus chungwhensis BH030062 TaxID=1385513 RepID=A0A0A2V082_9BACI|nr:ribonuclease H-like YkuK family protein [Pontibacillus chungwhensis]KGP92221.1 hypothetical protein N780_01295 [Pontibacillus chungwhensis BH030062]
MEYSTFYNQSKQHMTVEDVLQSIESFIAQDPANQYRLSIGTDSHVHKSHTRFITAIHIHRIGKGAWGALRNHTVSRKIMSLKEKISIETWLSQEVAFHFTPEYLAGLGQLLAPYEKEGASLQFEIHLDIGTKGRSKDLIKDMTERIDAMGIDVKIKPDAYAASSYANRYTK